MLDINLDYYKIFYYVGKQGSITLAAEELALTQPAVSQAIRNLENVLGCALFVRMSKGVRLTTEGEVLYEYVKRGYESIKAGERKLMEFLELEDGEICIGASDMTLKFYLLPYLEIFHEQYPQIKVTVTNAPTPETIEHLSTGKIDFGVISTPFQAKHSLTSHEVREIRDVFVVGRKFMHLKDQVLSYKELENLPLMTLEGLTSTRRYVTEFLATENVEISPEFELATSDMLVQFAKRSLGVASVVEDFAKEAIERGELFKLQFDKEIPKRQICLVYDEKVPMSSAAQKLMQVLKEGKV